VRILADLNRRLRILSLSFPGKLAWELSQVSVHSPDILEIPTKPPSAKERPAKAKLAGSQLKG